MANKVDTPLPLTSPGLINFRHVQGRARQYGTRQTIDWLVAIGHAWLKVSPQIPFSIGDISLKGGGKYSGHASHKTGVDADIRPLRKDGVNIGVTVNDPQYDRDQTRKLIKTIRANSRVKLIFFNDQKLIDEGLCSFWPNHFDHLHVRFVDVPLKPEKPPQVNSVLKRGDSGEAVRELQNSLAQLDYMRAAEVDGKFGYHTQAALVLFQEDHKLQPDGKVGKLTRAAISDELRG
jgi:penicillin-insensitive murein DD-endopeptidase